MAGSGRAFCTGAHLDEWNEMNKAGIVNDMAAPGLRGLCRREGKKPILATVNGLCMGGGFEMTANCDMVLASDATVFALPEVRRGVPPVVGCLPRLVRVLGLQRTVDLALTGRGVDARTLHAWGLVSEVMEEESTSTAKTKEAGTSWPVHLTTRRPSPQSNRKKTAIPTSSRPPFAPPESCAKTAPTHSSSPVAASARLGTTVRTASRTPSSSSHRLVPATRGRAQKAEGRAPKWKKPRL